MSVTSKYPKALDELAANKESSTNAREGKPTAPGPEGDHSGHHNELAAGVNAVQKAMGLSPAGSSKDVATRLEAMAAAAATAQAASQPLDSDLTAIAALTTTSYGRGLLATTNLAAIIGSGTVTPAMLATNSVEAAKIKAEAVTKEKLAKAVQEEIEAGLTEAEAKALIGSPANLPSSVETNSTIGKPGHAAALDPHGSVLPAGPVGNSGAFGFAAQYSLTTGNYDNAFGFAAQYNLTTGSNDNAFGFQAQYNLTTGSNDNAFGWRAQYSLTTGNYDNALGTQAQYSLTTGNYDNAFGFAAQYSLTTGNYDNAFGFAAQYNLTTGSNDNAFGWRAQYSLTTGSSDNALGTQAQYSLTTGSYDNAFGFQALYSNETGNSNTALGHKAGYSNVSGSGNVFLGSEAGSGETGSNKLYIANANTASPLLLGDFSAATLQVNGKWACNSATPQGRQTGGSLEKVETALKAVGILAA